MEVKAQESLKSKIFKLIFNLFPAYRRSGGKVIFIAHDWTEIDVRLALNWKTRNYVGSVFGGSIYAAIDPIYMLQLIKILGNNYVVWDKAAEISFIRPIKTIVYAKFKLSAELIETVKIEVAKNGKYILTLPVVFLDSSNISYASINKTLYIASKEYYNNRPKK